MYLVIIPETAKVKRLEGQLKILRAMEMGDSVTSRFETAFSSLPNNSTKEAEVIRKLALLSCSTDAGYNEALAKFRKIASNIGKS